MPSIIQISDLYLLDLIEREQGRRGDATATKTARGLITERLSQIHTTPNSKGGNGKTTNNSRKRNRRMKLRKV